MKTVYIFLLNIFFVVFLWISFAFISPLIAKVLVFFTFLFFIIKNLFRYIFLAYYIFLFLSDSRLSILSFVPEIKPYVALMFYFTCVLYFIKRYKFHNTYKYIYISPFLIFVTLSLFFGDINFTIFQKSISYILLFIFSVPFIQDFVNKDNFIMVKVFVYSFIFVLLAGFVIYFFNSDITILNGRYRGLFGNPNGLGISIVLMFFIFQISKLKYENLFNKRDSTIIISVIFLNLILCQSRSCILSVLIFYAFNFLLNYSTFLAVISTLLLVLIYGFISVNILEFIKILNLENYIRLDTLENASGRYIAWDFIWDKLNMQTFLFGNGLGSTELLFKKNYFLLSKMGHEGNAHNSFLTIWYDTGLMGLISFLFFIIMSFLKSDNFLIYLPVLIGVLLSAFFESWMSASLNPFTILLLLIIVIIGSDYYKISTNG